VLPQTPGRNMWHTSKGNGGEGMGVREGMAGREGGKERGRKEEERGRDEGRRRRDNSFVAAQAHTAVAAYMYAS